MKNSIKRVQSESSLSALSSVRILREAKKIFQYILMVVAVVATASCSNGLDEALQPAGNGTLQFVVSDFPAFGEGPETRAIGTQDEGKTTWAKDDQIIITLTSQRYGEQVAVITYDGTLWSTAASLSYLENETPTVSVIYAPCYEVTEEDVIQLKDGMRPGMTEYVSGKCEKIEIGMMTITFEGATRDYSRLRIVGSPNQTLTVTTTGFTPAGATTVATEAYTLTTNNNGNAFLYGIFEKDATVSVMYGAVTLAEFTFSEENGYLNGTTAGTSYALDARPIIDGTLGGKTEASEEDITALVEQLKTYVDNGITTITVTGRNPAIIDMGNYTNTAIGEAIYRLSGSGTHSENDQYNGTIDLILPDVTEIVDYEFEDAYALNSITLPNVTKLGYQAFYDCQYLKKITFGSVVAEGSPDVNDFLDVGTAVDGCDLVLNRGQATAATEGRVVTPVTADMLSAVLDYQGL